MKAMGLLLMEMVNESIDNIYEDITTGKSDLFTKSEVVNDREALKRKSKMFFVWPLIQEININIIKYVVRVACLDAHERYTLNN